MIRFTNLIEPFLRAYIHYSSKKCVPDYDNDLMANHVSDDVEIIRDTWAVPHIYAKNERDMFFAQGLVHAQDRMWQMEVTRRAANGQLSEIFGKDALVVDTLSRRIGFKRLANNDLDELIETPLFPLLSAYVEGINFYLSTTKHQAVEFTLAKITPRKWKLEDTLAIGRLLAMQMTSGWLYEIERYVMYQEYGSEKMKQLFPSYPSSNPSSMSHPETNYRDINELLHAFNGPYFNIQSGSNNWVMSKERMEDQANYLCNDPHLLVNTPNIWYENHLINPDYQVTGVSMAGVPMVMIGHNDKISWGATLTYADIQDSYIETFTDDSCSEYIYKGEKTKSTQIEERIHIKGEPDHIEKVIVTHNGPVIVDIDETTKISLRSFGLLKNEMIVSFYELNRARDWNDFVSACQKMIFPSLNLVYADVVSNIGYYMTGKVPVREREKETLPTHTSTQPNEWVSYVPFEEMPHVFNPSSGYFYTCNHKIPTDDYPYFLGNIWMNGYRAKTLDRYLRSKETFHVDDFKKWQMDVHCQAGVEFVEAIKECIERLEMEYTDTIQICMEQWNHWNGLLDDQSIPGTIYQVFKRELYQILFKSDHRMQGHVGNKQLPLFTHSEFFGHDSCILIRLMKDTNNIWWNGSCESVLREAFEATYSFLTQSLGKDLTNWKWGALHKMTALHGMSVKEPLGNIFNTGGFPIGGDTDTLCQVAFSPDKPYGGAMVGASYRQIINMSDLDQSICISPVGQSGHVVSKHYADQQEMWRKGVFKPMIWSRGKVMAYKKYRMRIRSS